jgi:hypothetical protein
MRIGVHQGQVTLIADTPVDESFLVTLATTFQEGGTLIADPSESLTEMLFVEPATPVTT